MRRVLFLFLLLVVSNVYASEDGMICSYSFDNKHASFYYTVDDNFVHFSEIKVVANDNTSSDLNKNYYLLDHTSSDFARNSSSLVCPALNTVELVGDDKNVYCYITDNDESFNALVVDGVIYDKGEVVGQIKGEVVPGVVLPSIDAEIFTPLEISQSAGVAVETIKVMNNNIDAYVLGGYCSAFEKNVIVNYFFEYDFDTIHSFNIAFDYKGEKVTLSDKCADAAYTLYVSTKRLGVIIKNYVDNGGDTETLPYLSLVTSYYAAHTALTTGYADLSNTDKDACALISGDVENILNMFFDIFRIVCIVLAIFMIYLDGMKCIGEKDDSKTKEWLSNTLKRLIALIIIVLLPFLIDLVLDLLNSYFVNNYVEINGECVKNITGV